MADEALILNTVEAGVATLTFNRPDKMNALTPEMLELFFREVRKAAADPEVRVIVVTGAGRGCCAGMDLAVIGPGRSDSGNFVLAHLSGSLVPLADVAASKPLRFTSATADFSQNDWPVASSLVDDEKGWGIHPNAGVAHWTSPAPSSSGTIITPLRTPTRR